MKKQLNMKRIRQIIHHRLLGMQFTDGIVYRIILYLMLIALGFVFLYPIIYMVITSMKSDEDIVNSAVKWIPYGFDFNNYKVAFSQLGLSSMTKGTTFLDGIKNNALTKTITIAGIPALSTVISTGMAAYGFSRFKFPLKKLWFVLMLITFIITPQILLIPQYVWFRKLGLLGTLWTYILPASLAQGLNASLFILILFSMFNMIPQSLIEAAKIDGAGNFSIFTKIAIPLTIPGFIIVFLFSFVWYWNEINLASLYFGQSRYWTTLPMNLGRYITSLNNTVMGEYAIKLYQPERMAATLIIIIPLLVLYFALQRHFVESIDRSGITGE